ncbi:hypothetical protein [Stigmatella aurantiaca]|uniref:hypothetical protein n=1 Tax=Stigmatella aurantiaca TaxID=41 RepID=UPI001E30C8B6|nr:hypothetical protein [Stigmatella aurantiaca]
MMRTSRLLRFALLGLTLVWATPAPAQSFEGLDVPGASKKKRKPAASKKKKKPAPGQEGR